MSDPFWYPQAGEHVTHPEFDEGVVDFVGDDGGVRVKYQDVTAWSDWKNLAPVPTSSVPDRSPK